MSALNPLMQAIYSRLTGDATLSSKVTGVFDSVPESQLTPYIVMDQADSVPFVTYDRFGETVSIEIYIFSTYRGYKEINDIASDIQRLLANVTFNVTGYDPVACYFDSANIDRLSDADTRVGIQSYRIQLQKQ